MFISHNSKDRDEQINNLLLNYNRRSKGINCKTKHFLWSYEEPKQNHFLIEDDNLFGNSEWPAEWVIRSILRRFEDFSNIEFKQTRNLSEAVLLFCYSDKYDGIYLDENINNIFEFESYIYFNLGLALGVPLNNHPDSIMNTKSHAFHPSNEDIIIFLKKFGQIF